MTVDGHLQKKMILTLGAGGIDFTGSFSAAFFKGVSVAQRSAMLAHHFLMLWLAPKPRSQTKDCGRGNKQQVISNKLP